MIQWSTFKGRISRALNDTTYTDGDLLDYINQALVAISAHTAQERMLSQTLLVDTTEITLPDDLLEMGPVHAVAGMVENNLYRGYRLVPGASLPLFQVGNQLTHVYYRWGNTLRFLTPVLGGRQLSVHYFAYWARVEKDEDQLMVYRWMEEPLQWYCLHLAMQKPGIVAAKLRQWNTKQDSGTPTDNSPAKFAEFCLQRYQSILNDAPTQDRTGWEARV